MSQIRYNPASGCDEFYYRIKESFRDLTGRVRSCIMLNVGFIDENRRPEDIRELEVDKFLKEEGCSEPTKETEEIYDKLKYKKMPFRKIKINKSL